LNSLFTWRSPRMATFLTRLHRVEQQRETLARWRLLARLQTCSDEELTAAVTNGAVSCSLRDLSTPQLLRLYQGEHLLSVLANPHPHGGTDGTK
jgi:hypothetical protein